MKIERYGSRNWAVYDNSGELVCVTVYKKGAKEVVRRLEHKEGSGPSESSSPTPASLQKLLKEIRLSSKQIQKLAKQYEM